MTLIVAALPVSEVRGAIPLAIGVYGFSPLDAYLLSVFGNLLPIIPLLLFLGSNLQLSAALCLGRYVLHLALRSHS